MNKTSAILGAGLLALITACANNAPPTQPKGIQSQFTTRISDSGLKVFEFKASSQLNHRSKSSKPTERLEAWLNHELTQQLINSQFCETGHTEIERSIGQGFAVIRGECNELAKTSN